jgi:NADPH:quinone reductase
VTGKALAPAFALSVAPTEPSKLLPPGIEMELVAALVLTYGTSHYALKDRAVIRHGETLLVLD